MLESLYRKIQIVLIILTAVVWFNGLLNTNVTLKMNINIFCFLVAYCYWLLFVGLMLNLTNLSNGWAMD